MLLGIPAGRPVAFRLQGYYLLWRPFPWPSSTCWLCHSLNPPVRVLAGPTTPPRQRHRAITPCRFRLFPVRSPLLGESRLLSLPHPTEMFQFGRFPPQALCVQTWVTGHDPGRVAHASRRCQMLLRKEVIQPHLPVRLPCYDFTPIADPTFDGSLPRVGPPASGVTDFRGVTGGVYKARERIHRSIADLRLLATPTSRGRVADPDPN